MIAPPMGGTSRPSKMSQLTMLPMIPVPAAMMPIALPSMAAWRQRRPENAFV